MPVVMSGPEPPVRIEITSPVPRECLDVFREKQCVALSVLEVIQANLVTNGRGGCRMILGTCY